MRAPSSVIAAVCLFAGASYRCGQTPAVDNGGGSTGDGVDGGAPTIDGGNPVPDGGTGTPDGGNGGGGPLAHVVNVTRSGPGAVRSSPSGIDCGTTCSATFTDGTVVTISAHPESGTTFTGWKGACSGTSDCTITVNGDSVVIATFEARPPPPPDECARLRPDAPGEASRSHSVMKESEEDACLHGVSDGRGTLALMRARIHGEIVIDFVSSSSGEPFAQGSGSDLFLLGRQSGFLGENFAGGASWWIQAWDTKGTPFAQAYNNPANRPIDMAEDPTGGIVVANFFPENELESDDDQLNERWRTTVPGVISAFNVDRAGRTLILFSGDDRYGTNSVAGMWVDHDGTAGPVFQAFGPQPRPVQSMNFFLEPRVGSGLFIGSDAGSRTWVGQIDSLGASVSAAPAWLLARTSTHLHMVHNGAGYAVLPERGASADCSQTIEVVAPSGKSCGTATFRAGSGSCDVMNSIVVGYDGTVMQNLPDSKEQQCFFGACTCTWQWWPGFFR